MDVSRAKEILHSREKINVELNGTPVWIDEVNEQNQTASVHDEQNPQDKKNVSVEELRES